MYYLSLEPGIEGLSISLFRNNYRDLSYKKRCSAKWLQKIALIQFLIKEINYMCWTIISYNATSWLLMYWWKNKKMILIKSEQYQARRRKFSLVAHYSLKFTRCSLLVVKSLVTRCKIYSLLIAEVAPCKKSLFTRCKIRSLLVAKKSLVTRCKIRPLLVAELL